ncbi:DUF2917 domain-containing protein [Variovorax sp. J22R133]|uniref:DUF2917 domain-containing protein n=1 Tax=Variovorax brevis TaxID=3053503 RepID=UPI0025781FD0|nr:DUF2917 domain-containing protein [Variovorax sp. J22R133]MDM0115557.1 DUF2917 domain-containing protein [Variovorax sp. J22R133]
MTTKRTSRFQIDLPAHAIVTLPDAAGVGVECRSGCIWITLDDDARDIVLEPGERYVGELHRRALVSALEASTIAVSDAQPVALPNIERQPWSPWRLLPHGLSPA